MEIIILILLLILVVYVGYLDIRQSSNDIPTNRTPDGTVRRVRHVEKDNQPERPRPVRKSTSGTVHYYITDTENMTDIIEINNAKPYKPESSPAVYMPPPKPVPEKPKITVIAETQKSEPAYVKEYEPNEILTPVIAKTREEYQLPPGAVEMPIEETAVISAVILYFIQEEPKIGITKLESYIILLDKLCFDEKGRRLFSYKLTYGPFGYYIQNFRAFLDYLQEKGILSKKREYYTRRKYRMDFTAHHEITSEIFPSVMLDWMNRILVAWRGAGADHTKRSMLMMLTSDALKAFTESPSLE